MDDRVVHYYVMLSDLCEAAYLGRIPLRITTTDAIYHGVTRTLRPTEQDPERGEIEIDNTRIALHEILSVSFETPASS